MTGAPLEFVHTFAESDLCLSQWLNKNMPCHSGFKLLTFFVGLVTKTCNRLIYNHIKHLNVSMVDGKLCSLKLLFMLSGNKPFFLTCFFSYFFKFGF